MTNDKLNDLAKSAAPSPSDAARKRALMASMAAFDDAQIAQAQKKFASQPQGPRLADRLRTIATQWRSWTMTDLRIPVGTAAIALLVLPLGYQLYTSTALSPADRAVQVETAARGDIPVEETKPATADKDEAVVPPIDVTPPNTTMPSADAVADDARAQQDIAVEQAPAEPMLEQPEPQLQAEIGAPMPVAPAPLQAPIAPRTSYTQGIDANQIMAPPPTGAVMQRQSPGPHVSGDTFAAFEESPVKSVAEAPVSTFSVDVDTASYAYARSELEAGMLPQADAVRIEEMINYFPYGYAGPTSAEVPFATNVSVFPTPWNAKTQLVQIGIKGYVPPAAEAKPANLVFLIDTSGSMDEANKLPLLKRAFGLLVERMGEEDTISIVTYAGSAGVALEPTKASEKAKILGALDGLYAGGSTAGGAGIELAYKLAEQHKIANGINRVILATDGDFNVGLDDPDQLKDYIETRRDNGIFLSVLGFGRGNLDDALMQSLAQNGNGQAAYIDTFREAQKVLVAEAGGTLQTIAKDVKIQVEFNPATVAEYRLVGYETRALNREDFNNDKVDAGDIGAGHTVTALYEITPAGGQGMMEPLRYGNGAQATGNADELAFLRLRYKAPDSDTSQLIETPIKTDMAVSEIAKAGIDQRFAAAVAAFGQKLKGSTYAGDMSWADIKALAQGARGEDEGGYRAEFVQLVDVAASLKADK